MEEIRGKLTEEKGKKDESQKRRDKESKIEVNRGYKTERQ